MKRGVTTMEMVVVAVLALAVAAAVVFVILKVQQTQKYGERFLPARCEITGLTQEQYVNLAADELARSPPDRQKAAQLRNEMKGCFPDAELPADLLVALQEKKPGASA